MKQLNTWLTSPIGEDQYGTAGLTGLQFIIACTLVMGAFLYLAYQASRNHTTEL